MIRYSVIIVLFICLNGIASPLPTLSAKDQGWSLYDIHNDVHQNISYLVSKPIKQEGSYDRRGPVWLFIFKRNVSNPQVMIDLGYQTVPNQPYAAIFDNEKKYILIPKGTKLYLNQDQTESFCKDIKINKFLHIYGVSTRQNKTTDTYTLSGFTGIYKKLMHK